MDNRQVAHALETLGQLLELRGENPFKIRAYQTAARAIDGLSTDVRALIEQKTLDELPGIGRAIADKVVELVSTGRLEALEKLKSEIPSGIVSLLRIPSLGPKKARVLWKELGIVDLDGLRQACQENRLVALKGFGEKTQKKLLDGIEFVCRQVGCFLLNDAVPVARALVLRLQGAPTVHQVSVAGSLRRWKEVVRDIDLLVSADEADPVMEHFVRSPGVSEVLGRGDTKTSVRLESGLQVDLRVVRKGEFPYALLYFTGSKEHNVALRGLAQKKGFKLNEYGLFEGYALIECADESGIYEALGLPYIPPELRESAGELNQGKIPQLIEYNALTGVFHTHSTWSDGTASIEAMAEKARSMGLKYLGLSDHSKAAAYANGLDEVRLAQQSEEIDRLNHRWSDFRILKGIECDILPDGRLDLSPQALGALDFVIGSVHSRFDMPEEEMTERICRALENEHLDMLGHLTGRILLSRDGYKLNLDRVLETAHRHNKIIELNAYPNRLELDAVSCRKAKAMGVMVSINPDAHSTADLENIEYGIATARRGWLGPQDVLNTRDLDAVLDRLQS